MQNGFGNPACDAAVPAHRQLCALRLRPRTTVQSARSTSELAFASFKERRAAALFLPLQRENPPPEFGQGEPKNKRQTREDRRENPAG